MIGTFILQNSRKLKWLKGSRKKTLKINENEKLKTTILTAIIAIGFYANVNAQEKSNAKIAPPKGGDTTPTSQVYKFNNGCSRTCTGDWHANSNGTVGCDGTAGPLICPIVSSPNENNSTAKISLENRVFNQDGTLETKVKTKQIKKQ